MNKSSINIDVHLDAAKMPETITWHATGSSAEEIQKAKAMFLSFWDGTDKTALRIDLWTKSMMVDEMADFYYQVLMGMADTFNRATKQEQLSADMKIFAQAFLQKFRDGQVKENG